LYNLDAAGPLELVNLLLENGTFSGDETPSVGEPMALVLGSGTTAVRVDIVNSTNEGLFIAIDTGNGAVWLVAAVTAHGMLTEYEPAVLLIAETLNK
jgi:hypothetical protein